MSADAAGTSACATGDTGARAGKNDGLAGRYSYRRISAGTMRVALRAG
jgi:hypothetical protein